VRTLAVIPARLGATRLARKPLRLLGGVPLVVRVWERVAAMRVADRVVVATDSSEIAAALAAARGDAVLTASTHPSGTDRVAEVAALPEFSGFDAVVNVQGDEPFVRESAVRGAVSLVTSGRFPLGTAAARAGEDVLARPDVVKVVTADDGRALYFSRAPIPWLREPDDASLRAGHVRQHIGVYAYTRAALAAWVELPPHPLERIERLEQLRPLAAGHAIGVALIDDPLEGGVDTEQDLERANARWTELFAGRT
jgi:3-deoxy-manno-octulosonate cytidylyltransferase (CMP-KDO synthetase)